MNKFATGQVYWTAGINEGMAESIEFAEFVLRSFQRHENCDWGEMCDEDKQANDEALKTGERLFSAYKQDEWKVWCITEADRSSTCLLFPDEY